MREDQIGMSVGFLQHPSVVQRNREEKVAFLRSKGLSTEEIEEAFRRVEGKTAATTSPVSQPAAGGVMATGGGQPQPTVIYQQMPMPVQTPPEQPFWAKVLVPLTLALSTGAGLTFLYKTFLGNDDRDAFPWETPGGGAALPFGGAVPNPTTMPPSAGGSGGMPMTMMSPQQQQQQQQHLTPQQQVQQQLHGNDGSQSTRGPSHDAPWNQSLLQAAGTAPSSTALTTTTMGSTGNGGLASNDVFMLRRSLDEQASSVREVTSSLKLLVDQMAEMQRKQLQMQPTGSSSKQQQEGEVASTIKQLFATLQSQSELKAELAAIKALLVASHLSHSGGANATLGGDGGASRIMNDASALADLSAILNLKPSSSSNNNTSVTGVTQDDVQQAHNNSSSMEGAKVGEDRPESGDVGRERNAGDEEEEEEEDRGGEAGNEEALERKKQTRKSREALAAFVSSSSTAVDDKQFAEACNLLIMFLRNLLNEPKMPRFRRIARGNANYKKSLEPVPGHLAFLEAMGFEERGPLSLELNSVWVESLENTEGEGGWARAVFQDAITNLESLKASRNGTIARPDSAGSAALGVGSTVTTPAPASPTTPSSSAVRSVGVGLSTPYSAVSSGTSSAANTPYGTPASRFNPSGQSASSASTPARYARPVGASAEEEGDSDTRTNGHHHPPSQVATPSGTATPTTTTTTPSYPLSMKEVMELTQAGKKPPGIKEIPNQLSADAASLPGVRPQAKPWEVNGGGGGVNGAHHHREEPTSFAAILAAATRQQQQQEQQQQEQQQQQQRRGANAFHIPPPGQRVEIVEIPEGAEGAAG